MEIAIKAMLGALVAVVLHLAANSKHYFLTGLVPLFPTFALFAHAMFASQQRGEALQTSAIFGLWSLIPYATYLILIWVFASKVNLWAALALSIAGWSVAALVIVFLWVRTG